MGKRRKCSAEFKREPVTLTADPDVSVAQVARECSSSNDGTSWTGETTGTTEWLFGVWGIPAGPLAVGSHGIVAYHDETSWVAATVTTEFLIYGAGRLALPSQSESPASPSEPT